jgi:S-adenosylmethionine decarboxylase
LQAEVALCSDELTMVGASYDTTSPVTSDGESSDADDYTPGCFEGPEKNLECIFKFGKGHPNGCREIDREGLDAICAAARCTIITSVTNSHLDAYVLSESSLFVYTHKIIMKTCGRTTLLRCLHSMLRLTGELGLELEWIGYSRKNFSFPDDQYFPHTGMQDEFAYLKKHPSLDARLGGSGYVLGPITGDHWLAYISDKTDPTPETEAPLTDRNINIMMFDMDEKVSSIFFQANSASAKEMTEKSGIDKLVPGALIDDRAFEPCGYSMNAILYGSYSTVHITPEPECSYASFETNTPLKSYTSLINNVLEVFRPARVVITMIADSGGLPDITEDPFANKTLMIPSMGRYTRSSSSFSRVEGDCCVQMGNWELDKGPGNSVATEQLAHRKATRLSSF